MDGTISGTKKEDNKSEINAKHNKKNIKNNITTHIAVNSASRIPLRVSCVFFLKKKEPTPAERDPIPGALEQALGLDLLCLLWVPFSCWRFLADGKGIRRSEPPVFVPKRVSVFVRKRVLFILFGFFEWNILFHFALQFSGSFER